MKIQTIVNGYPLKAFFLVLILLQNKNVLIEELLQLFIGKIDAELLKTIVLRIKGRELNIS